MGKKEDIRDVIIKLEKGSDEIIHVLVVSTELNVQSSVKNPSMDDDLSAAKFYVAIETIEDAISDRNIDFEIIKIESAGSSIIAKRADTAFIVVQVTNIVPANCTDLFTESGPAGTIKHIDDAVEEIKAVLSEQ
ncbi:MAG: hypothetical protein KAI71_04295 [Candidatus Pacebacteria bacterium]|nr:hypothetical protein [Candidatus Paceibacterota bacterium]